MTRKPVGTELMITPSRLSILGLITMGANDSGIHNEVQTMIMIECQIFRSRFTRELMRLKPQVPHLPRPLVSGSCRTFQMEEGSQVATRKDFYERISGKFPKEISEEKGPNLHDTIIVILFFGLISYSKYAFIIVPTNY